MGGSSQNVIDFKKSQRLSYSFLFLHQGGQACLVPFFSLYIRQLGMNGAQTGLIIAASFASCMVALPFWKWLSGKLGQHRIVILICLIGTIAFNMLLVAVPPIIPDYTHMYCSGGRLENATWWTDFITQINRGNKNKVAVTTPLSQNVTETLPRRNVTTASSPDGITPASPSTLSPLYITVPFKDSLITSSQKDIEKERDTRILQHHKRTTEENSHNDSVSNSAYRNEQTTNSAVTSTKQVSENEKETMIHQHYKRTTEENIHNSVSNSTNRNELTTNSAIPSTHQVTGKERETRILQHHERTTEENLRYNGVSDSASGNELTTNSGVIDNQQSEELYDTSSQEYNREEDSYDSSLDFVIDKNTVLDSYRNELGEDLRVNNKKLSDEPYDANSEEYNLEEDSYHNSPDFVYARNRRDLFTSAYEGLSGELSLLKEQMESLQHQTVLVTILILLSASMFGCAVGPLFDEAWFEFLDDIDELEIYGRHQIWGGLGWAVTPIIAACIVDGTPCILPDGTNHMVIHIYLMAFFMFWSLVVAFFQPVYGKLSKRQPKLLKGIKLLFTDVHCGVLAFTVLIIGVLSASMHVFMFWVAEDIHSIESPMGIALAIGGATRLTVIRSGPSLVEKCTPAKVVVLGLLALAVQLIFVSYLWSPWALIVSEGLTGLSQGAVWQAVQHHPDFALHLSNTERTVLAILHVGYEGLALPLGCIVSGFVYDHFGPSTLFQGASIIAVLWCVIFTLIHACVPKEKRLQYSKLLGAGEDDTKSNDSFSYEEDWLEAALKNTKRKR